MSTQRPVRLMWATAVLLVTALAPMGVSAQQQAAVDELTELSLQELMNLEVVSVSKTARKLSDSAAAVYVITAEQIRRSGATTVPELLRTVPGLQVARIDSNKWAISARGFNGRFANKLLVLIDGRSVYTPLFSGVFWDLQDVLLEDIDRIEVVRGPGATLWGANAVNGVINIITRPTNQTRGTLVSFTAGSSEGAIAGFRHGGALGADGDWRIYGKASDRSRFTTPAGAEAHDGWELAQAGFRIDVRPDEDTEVRFQGDIYAGEMESTYALAIPAPPFVNVEDAVSFVRGGNLQGEYRRSLGTASGLTIRGYYDRTDRDDGLFSELRQTYDLEVQHEAALGEIHHLVWGVGYRRSNDQIGNSFTIRVDPPRRGVGLFNAFVQDDIRLAADQLRLTLGTKVEHNDYTGWELQPNARFLWHIDDRNTLWGAVSRAVRTPSRVEHDGLIIPSILPPFSPMNPGPLPVAPVFVADGEFESEALVAYELGYRWRPADTISFDLAAFLNDYDGIRNSVVGEPVFVPPALLWVPARIVNGEGVQTSGFELAAEWSPGLWVRLQAGYTYFHVNLGGREVDSTLDVGSNPSHQGFVWASFEPFAEVEADVRLRGVSELAMDGVPGYVTADARLSRTFPNGLELALVGWNLFHERRLEFISEFTFLGLPAEVERSVYLAATWHF